MGSVEAKGSRRRVAVAISALAFFAAESAHAFCRTTTCDPRTQQCERDGNGCIVNGVKLAWPGRCISFAAQKDGSPLRGISYDLANSIIRGVFTTWMNADCGGGRHPSIRVYDIGAPLGGVECAQPEFNDALPNASIWMFRDDDWPYYQDNATLGLTTVQYEKGTGVILDADVEINSKDTNLSTSDTNIQADLASIATHEAGHFLGLSHSPSANATMYARYEPRSLDIRILDPDDMEGICTAYPPDRDVVECDGPYPPHGFTQYCLGGIQDKKTGCSVAPPPSDSAAGHFGLAGLVVGLARFRRRRG